MDDSSFERWSKTLAELRSVRQKNIDMEIQNKAESFSPINFFELAQSSLEQIMEKWFEYETQSWEAAPPADPTAALEAIRSEMESIVDFELESIERDMVSVQSHITWLPGALQESEPSYRTFVDELRKKYQIKAKSLQTGGKKKMLGEPGPAAVSAGYSSPRNGNGVSFFLMFLVGLLMGGGPSIYFMDASKKTERKYQEERSRLIAEQRALADSMTFLKDSFDQFVEGKMKSMPDLTREIRQTKLAYVEKRKEVERNYLKNREKTLKKIPAGNRLDAALDELRRDKDDELGELAAQEAAELEPLTKQQQKLKELIAQH